MAQLFIHDSITVSAGPINFYHDYIGQLDKAFVSINETITLSDSNDPKPSKWSIEVDDTITLSDVNDPKPSKWSLEINESLSISDTVGYGVEVVTVDETITLSDSVGTAGAVNLATDLKVNGTNLFICSYTDPVRVAKIDISTGTPTFTVEPLNGASENYANAKSICINDTFALGYIACEDGIICEFDTTNLNTRREINCSDTDDLQTIACLDDFKYIYTGTENTTSELYMVDDTTKTIINTRFSILKQFTKSLDTILTWIQGKIVNTRFSILKTNSTKVKTDFRFLTQVYDGMNTSDLSNTTITLDGVDVSTEAIINSIRITKNDEGIFTCTFTLPRYHDRLDYDVDGNLRQITNKNTVVVTFNGIKLFNGKVKRVTSSGQSESVDVEAEQKAVFEKTQVFAKASSYTLDTGASDVMEVLLDGNQTTQYTFNRSSGTVSISDPAHDDASNVTVSYLLMDNSTVISEFREDKINTLALPSIDTQRHPFDIIRINNVDVYNPDIDENDANPEFYRGVIADLGVSRYRVVWQKIGDFTLKTSSASADNFSQVTLGGPTRRYLDVTTGDWIEDNTPTYFGSSPSFGYLKDWDTFRPQQGWTYFWTLKRGKVYPRSGERITVQTISNKYLGTSPAPLSNTLTLVDYMTFKMQRDAGERITDLGSYKIGSAPYKIVTPLNGKLIQDRYWEDREDGLYDVIPSGSFDNTAYVRTIANLEYEKLKNINGEILPKTTVSFEITLDAFLHYNIKLLNRINITNTIQADIFNGNNGFPVAVKTIDIDFGSAKVTLNCDNQKSRKEMLVLDATQPDIPEVSKGSQFRIIQKYSIETLKYVS